MKGLLLKDLYSLRRTGRMYLAFTLLFAFLADGNQLFLAFIYALMLPINLMALDERSRFERLVPMLPLRGTACVLDKYIIGYAVLVVTVLISAAAHSIWGAGIQLETYTMMMGVCLLTQGIILMCICRFGVERGRMAYMIAYIAGIALLGAISHLMETKLLLNASVIGWIVLAAAAASNIATIPLAAHFYRRRMVQ